MLFMVLLKVMVRSAKAVKLVFPVANEKHKFVIRKILIKKSKGVEYSAVSIQKMS